MRRPPARWFEAVKYGPEAREVIWGKATFYNIYQDWRLVFERTYLIQRNGGNPPIPWPFIQHLQEIREGVVLRLPGRGGACHHDRKEVWPAVVITHGHTVPETAGARQFSRACLQ